MAIIGGALRRNPRLLALVSARLRIASVAGSKAVPSLVSTEWLANNLKAVKVVDASWYLPAMKRNGRVEYGQQRVPSDRDPNPFQCTDRNSPGAHNIFALYFSRSRVPFSTTST